MRRTVPFGNKYRGQPLEVFWNDTGYYDWCNQQSWYLETYAATCNRERAAARRDATPYVLISGRITHIGSVQRNTNGTARALGMKVAGRKVQGLCDCVPEVGDTLTAYVTTDSSTDSFTVLGVAIVELPDSTALAVERLQAIGASDDDLRIVYGGRLHERTDLVALAREDTNNAQPCARTRVAHLLKRHLEVAKAYSLRANRPKKRALLRHLFALSPTLLGRQVNSALLAIMEHMPDPVPSLQEDPLHIFAVPRIAKQSSAVDHSSFMNEYCQAVEGGLSEPARCVMRALEKLRDEQDRVGHSCLPAAQLPDVDMRCPPAARHLRAIAGHVYMARTYTVEHSIATTLQHVHCAPVRLARAAHEAVLGRAVQAGGKTLTDEQMQAVRNVLRHPLSIVTGGAGTGKSTVLQTVARAIGEVYPLFTGVNLAFTGQASFVLERNNTNNRFESHTIHFWSARVLGAYKRMLDEELDDDEDSARRSCASDLSPPALVVVDECSMIDADLMLRLCRTLEALDAMFSRMPHVVLLGDQNQLPPIDWGCPFAQLLTLPTIPHVTLQRVWRQEAQGLLQAVTLVRDRQSLTSLAPCDESFREVVCRVEDVPQRVLVWAEAVVQRALRQQNVSRAEDVDLSDCARVIAPTHDLISRITGVLRQVLNPSAAAALQGAVEFPAAGAAVLPRQILGYAVGDYVRCKRNDYAERRNTRNGMIGKVLRIATEQRSRPLNRGTAAVTRDVPVLLVRFAGLPHLVSYDAAEAEKDLEFGYAGTVHASQGSGYHDVLVVQTDEGRCPFALRSNGSALPYTAVSRARERCMVLTGVRDGGAAHLMAMWRQPTQPRRSQLAEMMRLLDLRAGGEAVDTEVEISSTDDSDGRPDGGHSSDTSDDDNAGGSSDEDDSSSADDDVGSASGTERARKRRCVRGEDESPAW